MRPARLTSDIGAFVLGEVPVPLEYTYLDDTNVVLNLTGFTNAVFQWGTWYGDQPAQTGPATVTDPPNGEVTYTWTGAEFTTTGRYVGMFFVNDGSNQFASVMITWNVCTSLTTPPSL